MEMFNFNNEMSLVKSTTENKKFILKNEELKLNEEESETSQYSNNIEIEKSSNFNFQLSDNIDNNNIAQFFYQYLFKEISNKILKKVALNSIITEIVQKYDDFEKLFEILSDKCCDNIEKYLLIFKRQINKKENLNLNNEIILSEKRNIQSPPKKRGKKDYNYNIVDSINKRLFNTKEKVLFKKLQEQIDAKKNIVDIQDKFLEENGNRKGGSYYFETDGHIYKYRLYGAKTLSKLYLKCSDPLCKGRGNYDFDGRYFELKVEHDRDYRLHNYFNKINNFPLNNEES